MENKFKNLPVNEQIDLSVIIVHYQTSSLLAQCLRSIEKSKIRLDYEIIVVDNNSLDGALEMLDADFPNVKVIANRENIGFPKAVNLGVNASRGRYLLLLNPDITVLPNSLEKMIAYLDLKKEIGVLGPKLINPNGTLQNSCFSFYPSPMLVLYRRTFLGNFESGQKQIKKFTMVGWPHNSGREVAWLLGSALMVRREAVEKVGLMDERFFMYMEDVDWCRRFWLNNYKVYYYPEVALVHYYARASDPNTNALLSFFNRQTRIHIISAIKFFLKYRNTNEKGEPKTKNKFA